MNQIVKTAYTQVTTANKQAEDFEREKEDSYKRKVIEQYRETAVKINTILSKSGRASCAFVGKHNESIGVFILIEGCSPIKVSLCTRSAGQGRPNIEELVYIVLFSSGKHFDDLDEAIVEAYEIYQNTLKNFQVEGLYVKNPA